MSVLSIDINCDLGEGMDNDAALMPFISSANIACGYHAGDADTIWQTLELARQHHVAAGAHVSFLDRENFGRTEHSLTGQEIYELVEQQLFIFQEVASSFPLPMHHVKPHGALYNMSAKDPVIARAIANAVKDFDPSLRLFGLSGSHSIKEAMAAGLETVNEVFADRTYTDEGMLTPRNETGALLQDTGAVVKQVLQMVEMQKVQSVSGKTVSLEAQTVCIHGDGPHAVAFAQAIATALKQHHIEIKAI